jgi:chaperonin GroEL
VELNLVFNAQSGDYKDMVAVGILDPTKVGGIARCCLGRPGLLITTEAMIADRPADLTPP